MVFVVSTMIYRYLIIKDIPLDVGLQPSFKDVRIDRLLRSCMSVLWNFLLFFGDQPKSVMKVVLPCWRVETKLKRRSDYDSSC